MARPTPTPDAEALASELAGVLDALISQYRRLGAAGEARRDAMRRAHLKHLAACIDAENRAVQEIADIEKRRVRVVGDLAARLGGPEKSQTRVTWIAERLGGESGRMLLERAQALRELMGQVVRQNDITRRAAEHLARHMEGLWRQAASVLNHAKTYGRAGVVAPGPSVVSALDLKS